MAESYVTVRGYGSGEYVEKKSRFIGSIAPVADVGEAEAFLAEVRPKTPGRTTMSTPTCCGTVSTSATPTTASPRGPAGRRFWRCWSGKGSSGSAAS